MSATDVLNNTGQNIFPNVTETERTSGLIRYRKVFIKKEDGVLDNARFFIDRLSTAEDFYRLKGGTDTDVQNDASGYGDWAGAGEITEALTGGASTTVAARYDSPDGATSGSLFALVDWDNLVSGSPVIEYAEAENAVFTIGEGDLADDDCGSLTGWTNQDNNGTTTQETFEGRETFKLTVPTAGSGNKAEVVRDFGTIPSSFTAEVRTYFDLIGTISNDDLFYLLIDNSDILLECEFRSGGLHISDGTTPNEVGTDIVDMDAWTVWRFVVDGSVPGSETVDVYKNGVLIVSGLDCSNAGSTDGEVTLSQHGGSTDGVTTYVDFLKISDGAPGNSGECCISLVSPLASSHSVKTRAKVDGTEGETFDVDGLNLIISIDGGAAQTVNLSGNGQTAAQVVDQVNGALSGGTASVLESTRVSIESDSYYVAGSVQVTSSSTAAAELGLDNSIHYGTDGTVVSEVLQLGSIGSSHTTPDTSGSASGTFNDSGYPVETYDAGTVSDDWTVEFSSAADFDVTGSISGLIGSGNINEDFQAANEGSYYFRITKEAWGGTWASGDVMTFGTVHSAKGIWIKEEVKAETPACFGNRVSFTLDGETS
jgi:hypothetical protein